MGDGRLQDRSSTRNDVSMASEALAHNGNDDQLPPPSDPRGPSVQRIPWYSSDLDDLPLAQLPLASEWPPMMFRDANARSTAG